MIVLGSKALITLMGINSENEARFVSKDIDAVMSYASFKSFIEKNKNYIKSLIPRTEHKYSAVLKKDGRKFHYEIELDTLKSVEWLLANKESICEKEYVDNFGNSFSVPNFEILYLTKKSHIYMPIHFEKNVQDYLALRNVCNIEKTSQYQEYYNVRHAEAKERFDKKSPSLMMTNDEFFDRSADIVGYVFIHDDIHEAVKHYDRPVYEMMKRDFESAWCEKDMFFNLPHEYQIRCVQEEAYVIALERYIVLQKGNHQDHFRAYKDALARICTTLCSGFFREFAVNNYNEIVDSYNKNFVTKFQNAVEKGLVRKMEHVSNIKFDEAVQILLSV